MRVAICVFLAATLAVFTATPATGQDRLEDECHWDRSVLPPAWVCVGGGGGGDDGPPPPYWTAWFATGFCVSPAGESLLWERSLIDGETGIALDTEHTCVEPDWDVIWDELSEAAAAAGVPAFDAAPPPTFGAVVGSPMLLWYDGQTQIPPITATITDPTGVVYGVEGRAWIEQITWNMGDGSAVTSTYRESFDESVFFGDFDNPETQYTYETTSITQGYPIDPARCDLAFTPVSVTLTWTGEYRSVEGVLQTTWTPVPANLDITETFDIPVREIRSALITEDYEPPEDCTWTD